MGFENVYSRFKTLANRAADRLNQTADIATLQVKLSLAQGKLDEAFAFLGRVSYEYFKSKDDSSEKIAAAVANVESVNQEIRALEMQIEEAKRRAAEQKAQWKRDDETARAEAEARAAEAAGQANADDAAEATPTAASTTDDAIEIEAEQAD